MKRSKSMRAFRRLALATTASTYLLILVGVLVRASGAGLGCPDWPKCFEMWIPPVSVSQLPPGYDPALFSAALTWMEYVNRLLGVTVGLLILATLVVAIRSHRDRPRLLWPTVSATLLVIFQGWLGGQVVRSGLESWMITAHLVVALIIVTLLLYATFQAYRPTLTAALDPARVKLARLGSAVTLLLMLQIALGTQVRAGIEAVLKHQPDLPRSAWLQEVVNLDYGHRALAQVVLIAVLGLALWIRRRFVDDRALQRTNLAVVLLLVLQIAMGVVLGYAGVPAAAQVLHLTAASLLLGALVLLVLQARHPEAG